VEADLTNARPLERILEIESQARWVQRLPRQRMRENKIIIRLKP
jgi:hypothetical protein